MWLGVWMKMVRAIKMGEAGLKYQDLGFWRGPELGLLSRADASRREHSGHTHLPTDRRGQGGPPLTSCPGQLKS